MNFSVYIKIEDFNINSQGDIKKNFNFSYYPRKYYKKCLTRRSPVALALLKHTLFNTFSTLVLKLKVLMMRNKSVMNYLF
jgi:hypothetical protein